MGEMMDNNPLLQWLQMHAPHVLSPDAAALMLHAPEKFGQLLDQIGVPVPTMGGLAQMERARSAPAYARDSYVGGGGGGANEPASSGPDITRIDDSVLQEWLKDYDSDPNARWFTKEQLQQEIDRRSPRAPSSAVRDATSIVPPQALPADMGVTERPNRREASARVDAWREQYVQIMGTTPTEAEIATAFNAALLGQPLPEIVKHPPPSTPITPEVAGQPNAGSVENPGAADYARWIAEGPSASDGASGTGTVPLDTVTAAPPAADRQRTIGSILEALAGVTMPPAPEQPYAPPPGSPQVGQVPPSQLAQLLTAMVASTAPLRFSQTQGRG